jgi:hypothetical protein
VIVTLCNLEPSLKALLQPFARLDSSKSVYEKLWPKALLVAESAGSQKCCMVCISDVKWKRLDSTCHLDA